MALAIAQSDTGNENSGAATVTATFPGTPTEGNALIAFVDARPDNATGNPPTLAVSDSNGAWSQLCTDSTTNHTVSIFFLEAVASQPTVITLTPTSGGGGSSTTFHMSIHVIEVSGWSGTPTADLSSSADSGGTNVASLASGSTGTLTASGDLVVSAGSIRSAATLSNGSSLTELRDYVVGPNRYTVANAWGEAPSTTAYNVTWTKDTGTNAQMVSMVATITDVAGDLSVEMDQGDLSLSFYNFDVANPIPVAMNQANLGLTFGLPGVVAASVVGMAAAPSLRLSFYQPSVAVSAGGPLSVEMNQGDLSLSFYNFDVDTDLSVEMAQGDLSLTFYPPAVVGPQYVALPRADLGLTFYASSVFTAELPSYWYTPPTVTVTYSVIGAMTHTISEGRSVLITDGVATLHVEPTMHEIDAADVYLGGGRRHLVTGGDRIAIEAAGLGGVFEEV